MTIRAYHPIIPQLILILRKGQLPNENQTLDDVGCHDGRMDYPKDDSRTYSMTMSKGFSKVKKLRVHKLKSIWKE